MVRATRTLVTVATFFSLVAGSASATETSLPLTPNSADIEWRYVLEKSTTGSGCPHGGAVWKSRPLVDAFHVDSYIHKGLVRYCVYEHSGGPVPPGDIAALVAAVGSSGTLERDRMAMGPAGEELADVVWPALAAWFGRQAGFVPLPPSTAGGVTQLAVLDTSPTVDVGGGSTLANSRHGYTLLNMAERMLCTGNGDCRAQVSSRLALPWTEFDPQSGTLSTRNDAKGGYVGSMLDLAAAIRGAVAESAGSAVQPQRNLVINLSVAWHPIFGGLESAPKDMPAAARAVLTAIEDAVCRGAIVIAAAGNVSNGPASGQGGPMLPAAWEQRPAPSAKECKRLRGDRGDGQGDDGTGDDGTGDDGGDDSDPRKAARAFERGQKVSPVEPAYRPLVYAVGGMQSDGSPLPNARTNGRPAMVAFGDHGVVEGHTPDTPTATLTGTSVATVVAAATAAAVWTYLPEFDAGQVMDLVYASGTPIATGTSPDFCLPEACPQRPQVHRIAVCDAVGEACALSPSSCAGQQPACEAWPPAPAQNVYDFSLFDQSADSFDAATFNLDYGTDPVCGATMLFRHPGLSANPEHPCPAQQFHGVENLPWVHPQPGTHACPNCSVTNGPDGIGGLVSGVTKAGPNLITTLRIEIDPAFNGTLSDPTITTASGIYSLTGAHLCLEPSSTCIVNNVPYPGYGPITLTYMVTTDDGVVRSASSPVVILP